jgi:4,5-DOPA dioxygenase extradiol
MPVLFVGHGSPMNVIEENAWSRGFRSLGALVPKPRAILAVSAHWYVDGTFLMGSPAPETIHDFGGFPRELYEITYPAPGSPDLAKRVRRMLGEERSSVALDWGLDHGTWSVLRWMYPDADIPVIQLSIDSRLDVAQHLDLGRRLAELRHEGVLILGSGNLTHNLRDAFARMSSGNPTTPDWAQRFDATASEIARQHDAEALLGLWPGSEDGRLCHPTGDHYLPFVYAFGAADARDDVRFPIEGFDGGSLSMRAILFG